MGRQALVPGSQRRMQRSPIAVVTGATDLEGHIKDDLRHVEGALHERVRDSFVPLRDHAFGPLPLVGEELESFFEHDTEVPGGAFVAQESARALESRVGFAAQGHLESIALGGERF